jgi:hypothetical protein
MSQHPLDYQAPHRVMSRRGRVGIAIACFVAGLAVTPVAMFLAIASGGAGHGGYEFARLFFPYSMLLTLAAGDTITDPLIALAWAQFPVYGLVLAVAALSSMKTFRFASIGIGALHAIAAIACFSGAIPNFS